MCLMLFSTWGPQDPMSRNFVSCHLETNVKNKKSVASNVFFRRQKSGMFFWLDAPMAPLIRNVEHWVHRHRHRLVPVSPWSQEYSHRHPASAPERWRWEVLEVEASAMLLPPSPPHRSLKHSSLHTHDAVGTFRFIFFKTIGLESKPKKHKRLPLRLLFCSLSFSFSSLCFSFDGLTHTAGAVLRSAPRSKNWSLSETPSPRRGTNSSTTDSLMAWMAGFMAPSRFIIIFPWSRFFEIIWVDLSSKIISTQL